MAKSINRQYQKQVQSQKLTPQFIQYLKFLEISYQKLDTFLEKEMEENPIMEIDKLLPSDVENNDDTKNIEDIEELASQTKTMTEEDSDFSHYYHKDKESNFLQNVISYEATPFEKLENQLVELNLNSVEKKIAEVIIGNLEDDGYLRRNLKIIINDLEIKQGLLVKYEQVERVLRKIHTLYPIGIAARNLEECLILQLKNQNNGWKHKKIAIDILQNHAENLSKRKFDQIQQHYSISLQELKEILEGLSKLNPKPGNILKQFKKDNTQKISPDFIVVKNGEDFNITVNNISEKSIKINPTYLKILEEAKLNTHKHDKKMVEFIKEKIERVIDLKNSIKQRKKIFNDVIHLILKHQKDFFSTGSEEELKPFLMKDVAKQLNVDSSVVSKILSGKYIETEYGTFPIKKFFFEPSYNQEGDEIKVAELKKKILSIIEKENKKKPISDIELTTLLNKKGYFVARRTISKYRKQLNVPKSSFRKTFL